MLHVVSLLWDHNGSSYSFSRCYNEEWVNKLYRGFKRNLSVPFRFVCFTDRERSFAHPEIEQERLISRRPDYGSCIEPYRIGEPMILVGLDTIVVGNVDHLAEHCLTEDKIALPRDPNKPERACNGVALVPAGKQYVYTTWSGQNDMEWMRQQPHVFLDDLFPGQAVSYKLHVKKRGLGDARIVYFHGREKPHELPDVPWVTEHWY